jgi:hypothetical protein
MAIKIKVLIFGLLLVPALFFAFAPQASAFDLFKNPCDKVTAAQNTNAVCNDKDNTPSNPIVNTIKKVANVIALIAGIAAVILIVISGFMFVTAGGSIGGQRGGDKPARIAKAKGTLSGALVGLVIVALAWTIVTFITDKFIH